MVRRIQSQIDEPLKSPEMSKADEASVPSKPTAVPNDECRLLSGRALLVGTIMEVGFDLCGV